MSLKKGDEANAMRKKIEDYSYVLSHNIGKGYSSQVFRGRNDLSDETVAVKVIDMKMIKGEVHKNLLASQIEVLKLLKNCENIIEVYDIYSTKNNTYIITELCDGGDLSKLISSKKTINENQAVNLMNQVISGYTNVYNRGIIHRDLKPANIFLKNSQIKLADFGFAMRQADCKKTSSYNVGSPVYMPPEALNENKYSFKSDIWALGVIYYEMLTGKTPWRAKTEKQLGRQLLSIPIKKLLPPSISPSSQNFLIKTLTVDINERMGPQQLMRFTLNAQKGSNIHKNLYFTSQIGQFDGKNNNIRRHETSITKNTVNTPTNIKRMTFLHNNNDDKPSNFSLPKTSATISNKTQHTITSSNKHIYQTEALTQKQINIQAPIKQQISYDKKYLSKQLLSQVHLCRFLYKLLARMNEKLDKDENDELQSLKEYMVGLIFDKLKQVENLKGVNQKYLNDYKTSSDFNKITQIIDQYQAKYTKDLSQINRNSKSLTLIKEQLTSKIVLFYQKVNNQGDLSEWKQEVIVLDYLVTMRQLIGLLQNNDLQGFHNKSKIQTIVEGTPSKTITNQHLNAIRSKLKAIHII